MAAPTPSPFPTPADAFLEKGFKVAVTFALDPNASLWPVDGTTPPGLDGGDSINITTHLNNLWRTFKPGCLVTMTEAIQVAAYSPLVWTQVSSTLLNKEGSVSIHLPDNRVLTFYGYLRQFNPQAMNETDQPRANVVITPTNFDPINKVEEGPIVA